MPIGGILLVALLLGPGCRPGGSRTSSAAARDSEELADRASRVAAALARPDTGGKKDAPIARWELPGALAEISGLALTPDGRLFAHGDERGRVAEIDYRRGSIVKQFSLGSPPVHGDFEAITWTPHAMFLLASNGKLFEFQEGADGASVDYKVYDTRLGNACEFEGVAFEEPSNTLLLACKTVYTESLQNSLVIYRWKLAEAAASPTPLTVPLEKLIGSHPWKGLHPSDITVEPSTGNYVLVASRQKALIEITPKGELVFARQLHGRHAQPEGVAITKDGILLISDEAGKSTPAAITLYRWP